MKAEEKRFKYFARRKFLWYWVVENELGRPVIFGSKGYCTATAGLLNLMWDNGYAHGWNDATKNALHEIRKYQ